MNSVLPLRRRAKLERAGEPIDLGFERLVFFSDAIIAIAITLLVLEIRLPAAGAEGDLAGALKALTPQFVAFFISFAVIGVFWVSHHRMFGQLRRYDRGLLWINLCFLFLIACVPIPTTALGRYQGSRLAVQFYAGSMALLSLVRTLMWRYAVHRRLTRPNLPPSASMYETLTGLLTFLVFLISIFIAQFSRVTDAMAFWFVLVLVNIFLRRSARPDETLQT